MARKEKPQPTRPRGGQTQYTRELADHILAELAKGVPLITICAAPGMPADSTVRLWVEDNREGFAAESARAYAAGYEVLAEQCIHISDTPLLGEETTKKADGTVETRTGDMLGHRKLQIDTRMRLLGKWAPKRYGDRQDVNVTGSLEIASAIVAARRRSAPPDPE